MKYDYETCYNLALDCKTRSQFKKKSSRGYHVALNNGWVNDYFWMDKPHRSEKGTWTIEKAIEESKKYEYLAEFKAKNQYAHNLLYKTGNIDKCVWLERRFLYTDESCEQISKNYKTVAEFNKDRPRAYQYAKEHGLLEKFTWLGKTSGTKNNPYWTRERIAEEIKKYNYRNDFYEHCPGAHSAIERNGWYDLVEYYPSFPDGNIYSCYVYDFPEYNTTYVGVTKRYNGTTGKNGRDDDHHGKGKYCDNPNKSPVYKFAKEHNITEYSPLYIIDGLTVDEVKKLEESEMQKYLDMGRTLLNKAKAGSLGQNGIKWTKEKVFEIAKQFTLSSDFYKQYPGAYAAAHRQGWHKEFVWMINYKNSKWYKYENCEKESKKYTSRSEFAKKSSQAYQISREMKWLDTFPWLKRPIKKCKYNYDICKQMCSECKNRKEMEKKHNGCLQWLRIHHKDWLDEFFPIRNKNNSPS